MYKLNLFLFFSLSFFISFEFEGVVHGESGVLLSGKMGELVQLRGVVEELGREMEMVQKEKQQELELWTQKKLELEALWQKETLRGLQIKEKYGRLEQRVKSTHALRPEEKIDLLQAVNQAKSWVKTSLPFKKKSRLQTLKNLEDRVQIGSESLEMLTAELWNFYENELKLVAENEFCIFDVEQEDGPQGQLGQQGQQKVEAVRLGLYAMLTRAPDGQFRTVVFENNQWQSEPLRKSGKSEADRWLKNMKAQHKTGLYELPFLEFKGRGT